MTLIEALNLARGPGINAVVGVLISILIEYVPEWSELDAKAKRPIILLICLLVPILATFGLVALGQVQPNDLDLWWAAILSGATAFSTSQLAHIRKLVPFRDGTD